MLPKNGLYSSMAPFNAATSASSAALAALATFLALPFAFFLDTICKVLLEEATSKKK